MAKRNGLEGQLGKLCYVRAGSGSTSGSKIVIVKRQTDDNCEAAELLIRSMFGSVVRSSRGTFLVTQ